MEISQTSTTMMAKSLENQTFGAQVVSKTLDYMNKNSSQQNGMNTTYDFAKNVLGAYSGLGVTTDLNV